MSNKRGKKKDTNKNTKISMPTVVSYGVNKKEVAKKLLKKHDVIRDPIFGDIWLTFLESEIINTPFFLRLKGINQLGPVHFVYPGATHNRFVHSLGVLFNADKIVKICRRNAGVFEEVYGKDIAEKMDISEYEKLVIRLVALLHDIAHIPFSHTFSKEGGLFSDEFNDIHRAPEIVIKLGEPSIADKINEVCNKYIGDSKKADKFSEELINDIATYIDDSKGQYPKPFIHDIVGNTICADLLDYTERDLVYCGLNERVGDRFLNYLAILPLEDYEKDGNKKKPEYTVEKSGKRKLVLLGYRIERNPNNPANPKKKIKLDVFSEAIDLLRKRYSLASKVYFHRTKNMLSSLLISAFMSSELDSKKILEMNDEKIIEFLSDLDIETIGGTKNKKKRVKRVKRLTNAYKKRIKYFKCYELKYQADEGSEKSEKFKENIVRNYRNPDVRLKAEMYFENKLDIEPGSISIYCPEENMNSKIYKALIQPFDHKSNVIVLNNIKQTNLRNEIRNIRKQHHALWSFCVYLHPDYNERKYITALNTLAFNLFDEKNEIYDLDYEVISETEIMRQQVIDELINEKPKYKEELEQLGSIVGVAEISSRGGEARTKENMKKIILGMIEKK